MARQSHKDKLAEIQEAESTLFILSWDCTGLEACIDVTKRSKEDCFDSLAGGSRFVQFVQKTLFGMTMRARYNSHRHYEIYTVKTDPSIDEEQMRSMFEQSPQGMADLIRERGNKIYSDRHVAPKIV